MKHDALGYFAILKLQPGASQQDIKNSYRRRAMALHPDRNQYWDTTEQFKALNENLKLRLGNLAANDATASFHWWILCGLNSRRSVIWIALNVEPIPSQV